MRLVLTLLFAATILIGCAHLDEVDEDYDGRITVYTW